MGVRVTGVGPGTIVDGRYTLQDRTEQGDHYERWTATDSTLGREVVLLAMRADDTRTEDALDAARRAAGVDHPTLVRILDVGRDGSLAFVIEESLPGSQSLSELVAEGGLPGEEVRRVTGEVSSALEAARMRGLHHLRLTPDEVFRTPDGEIRLRGLATIGVLTGAADAAGEDAPRRDAIGAVSLAYAGLTGLWPSGGPGGSLPSSLPAAPDVVGGLPAPSELAAGVPRDLDGLCRLTLNDHQGPTTPGDYARQIAPWSSRPIVGRPTMLTTMVQAPAAPEEDVAEDGDEASQSAAKTQVIAVGAAGALAAGQVGSAVDPEAGVSDPEAGVSADPEPGDGDPQWTHDPATESATDPSSDTSIDDTSSDTSSETPGAGAAVAAAGAAAAGKAAAAAGAASAAVSGAVGALGAAARKAADRAEDRIAERREHNAALRASAGGSQDLDTVTQRDIEPPAPLVPAEPLTKDESRVALGIVAAFLVLSLIVGLWGVSRIGSNTKIDLGGLPSAGPAATGSASPSPSASGTAAPSLQPLQILAANGFDPQGDGTENNSQAPRVFDGNPSTEWTSERYNSASFGGLKKGTGVAVDLGPNVQPKQVRLVLPVVADVEVYINGDDSLNGATKVGAKAGALGTVTFPVPATAKGQYLIVWFTQLTQDGEGKYRAHLAEVQVFG